MRKILANSWLQLVMRLLIGGIFVYAGVLKVQAPQAFADSIASFNLLPNSGINLLALALPPFEILTGLGLVVGWKRRAFALAIVALTVVFAIALSTAIARGLVVDCGCFGGGNPTKWTNWLSLGRDVLLFSGALSIYLAARPNTIELANR